MHTTATTASTSSSTVAAASSSPFLSPKNNCTTTDIPSANSCWVGGLLPPEILQPGTHGNHLQRGRRRGRGGSNHSADGDDEEKENNRRFNEAAHKLRNDLPLMLLQPVALSDSYEEDVQFRDNVTGLSANGLRKYNMLLQAFATTANMYLHDPELEILWVRAEQEEKQLLCRWRVTGKSRVSKHDTQWCDAVSTLHINRAGKVATHVVDNLEPINDTRQDFGRNSLEQLLNMGKPQPAWAVASAAAVTATNSDVPRRSGH